jgi:hypothetical protein
MTASKVFHVVPPGGVWLSFSCIAESLGNLYRKTRDQCIGLLFSLDGRWGVSAASN